MIASALALKMKTAFEHLRDGRYDDAVRECSAVLEHNPAIAPAWNLMGIASAARGEFGTAVLFHEKAVALDARFAAAWSNLGGARCRTGHSTEGFRDLRRALEIDAGYLPAFNNLLLAGHCVPDLDPAELAALHFEYGRRLEAAVRARKHARPSTKRTGPLRIGYLSSDLKAHSVGWFIEPTLANHDHARVHVTCYSLLSTPDAVTARLKSHADTWRDVASLSDEDIASQVAADRVDVLVDLMGHTAGQRLGVFARKPAPVQATWLGYPDTTGLRTIDWRITDAVADPPGATERFHVEKLFRLEPGFLCYGPPDVPLPARTTGRPPTFASFNDATKLNDAVIATWARLLVEVPGSRLLLKSSGLSEPMVREDLFARFVRAGASQDRVEVLPYAQGLDEHLARYGQVDVALDTFPYNGTTTTCEALWMGVPVVTLAGTTHVARVGASLLTQVGLGDLVASSPDGMVSIASSLVRDGPRCVQLHDSLRGRVRSCGLVDGPAFARRIEEAFEAMWSAWAEG